MDALWVGEDPPTSARKMLQNAVWGLRGILSTTRATSSEVLLQTRAPGYVLRVDPDQIDLFRFRDLVADGRKELAAGAPDKAAELLHDALSLWRGPALADLVEAGVVWSELTSMQTIRLAAMEDRFEAELRCGGHYTVLSDLEAMVEAEPFRERSIAQLMLALYRCGRQADALNVYARFRAMLADELGLDPGHELQQLQQSVLEQSLALALPGRPNGLPAFPGSSMAAPAKISASLALAAAPRREKAAEDQPPANATIWEQASAVITRADIDFGELCPDGVTMADAFEDVAAILRDETERFGGSVVASLGSYSLALFGANCKDYNHAERAVMAALAIRDRAEVDSEGRVISLRTAVSTGENTVKSGDGNPTGVPLVSGALMMESQELLALSNPGEVLACDRTRLASTVTVIYERAGGSVGAWLATGRRDLQVVRDAAPAAGHEYELGVLESLLALAVHRKRPLLVSVLGLPGSGKSWFLSTLGSRVAGHGWDGTAPMKVVRTPPFAGASGLRADVLAACCGIEPGDSASVARQKLTRTARDAHGSAEWAELVVTSLGPLLEPSDGGYQEGKRPAVREWIELVSRVLRDRPLVVFIDDLHLTSDGLLNFIEALPNILDGVPLTLIMAGRPELLERRPDWGGGKPHVTTLTLDSAPIPTVRRLCSAAS